jgi:CheY-like chemotaxis protein
MGEMRVRVECYSARKADERPVRFWLDEHAFLVEEHGSISVICRLYEKSDRVAFRQPPFADGISLDVISYLKLSGARLSSRPSVVSACGYMRKPTDAPIDPGKGGFQVQRIPLLGDFDPKKELELERKNPKLTAEEFYYLKSHLTLTREFGMQAGRNVRVRYRSQTLDAVDLAGVTANIGVISDITVTSGRFITETDDLRRADVVFIGEDVRDRFFPSSEAVGKTITVDGKPFQVIGTAAKKGSVFGFSRDNFVALATARELKTRGDSLAIIISDQRMPGMPGSEVLARSRELYPLARRVLLTAYTDIEAAVEAINEAHLDHYLSKPWVPPEERLFPVIDDLLDAWQAEYLPEAKGLRLVGDQWSARSHAIKDFLASNLIPYRWLDVMRDPDARALLEAAGVCADELPALFFDDGSPVLRNPEPVGLNPGLAGQLLYVY